MKDRVFVGPGVPEALAAAAATLGLPIEELRYVVLEAGAAGVRGLQPTPARIAILLQDPPRAGRAAEREQDPEPPRSGGAAQGAQDPEAGDPIAGLRAVVRALAEAGGLEIEAEIEDGDEALVVQLKGNDSGFFLGPEGRGELLMALEHLLQRAYGSRLYPQPLRVRCQGFREQRDLALSQEARQLAQAVRADGEPRTMAPLNAYERRVVHIALQDEPGVTTFSIGEGKDRRVTVAPRPSETTTAAVAPGGEEGNGR